MRHVFFVLTCAAIGATELYSCGLPAAGVLTGSEYEMGLRRLAEHAGEVAGALATYRQQHGRWPTNEEGLSVLPPLRFDCDIRSAGPRELRHWHRFMCDTLTHARSGAGILTPHLVPYFYENRLDARENAFAGSPVDDDSGRDFSIAIADGVTVWHVDGRAMRAERTALAWEEGTVSVALLLASFALAILWFRTRDRDLDAGKIKEGPWYVARGVLAVLLALAAFLLVPLTTPHGHANALRLDRRPKLVEACEEALDFYRDRGVLAPETRDRLAQAMKEDGETIRRALADR